MTLSIREFREHTKVGGDSLQLQGKGKDMSLKPMDKSFKGRVVSFLRHLFTPGAVAKDNKAVMGAFVSSISSNFEYGPEYGNMAQAQIQKSMDAGKPLTGRMVKQVFDRLDAHKAEITRQNEAMAEIYTRSTDPSHFLDTFSRIMEEEGLPADPKQYDINHMREDLQKTIVRGGVKLRGAFKPIGQQQAQHMMEKAIREFAAQKSVSRDSVDKVVSRESVDYGPVLRMAMNNPGKIKNPEYVKACIALREPLRHFVADLAGKDMSPEDLLSAFGDVSGAMTKKLEAMGLRGFGAQEMVDLFQDSLNLSIFSGDVSRKDMQGVMDRLSGDKGTQFRSALGTLMSISTKVRDDRIRDTRHELVKTFRSLEGVVMNFGSKLGMDNSQTRELLRQDAEGGVEKNVPRAMRDRLEARGFGAPVLDDGMTNNTFSTALDEGVRDKVEQEINKEFSSTRINYDGDGLSNYTQRDMGNMRMTLNGVSIDDTGAGSHTQGVANWREQFTRKDGSFDLEGAKALSTVMHQGLPISLNVRLYDPSGEDGLKRPFNANVGGQGENTTLSVTRDETTGDLWIKAEYTSKPTMLIFDDAQGEETVQQLDGTRSRHDTVVQGRIPRESIDSGQPRLEITSTHIDSYFPEG